MAVDPISFCFVELPSLFERAKKLLEQAAVGGDARAQKRLGEALAAAATARVVFDGPGGGEVFLSADHGELRVSHDKPAAPVLRYAARFPTAAAHYGVELITGGEVVPEGEVQAALSFSSARADQLFGLYKFGFDVEVAGLPEVGDVTMRFGLGRDLPTAPEFTLRVTYADLLGARDRRMGPQELFSSGKLVILGDVAKAMMLGMTLSQLR